MHDIIKQLSLELHKLSRFQMVTEITNFLYVLFNAYDSLIIGFGGGGVGVKADYLRKDLSL